MAKRKWFIRIILSITFSILSGMISIITEGKFLTNYINISFMIGLFLLMISGVAVVIFSGFFDLFAKGWKQLFFKSDPSVDRSHWRYEINANGESKDDLLRKNAKRELFIFIPLFISLFLIIQSYFFLYLLVYN
ncbi:DUF3899 domain-containing protein [Tepidibacillus decaturensis]|uniref:DUF3899 domain-containing protein n=1 Tax=Tepidibacillus decaturensis TaxID=1413211 RepID=UPI0008389D78|nr:DUF3899 domain-containing protein [Tepidibacillus decaturensis]